MARLGCKCGAEMSNTVTPSNNNLNIFFLKEAQEAIIKNPEIRLWDFYTGWDEKNNCNNSFKSRDEDVEYWFCTECKKIYEVQAISCGKILRIYEPNEKEEVDLSYILSLDELILLWDTEMDEMLSTNDKMTLEEYINQEKKLRYYISKDERSIFIVNNNSEIVKIYKQQKSSALLNN